MTMISRSTIGICAGVAGALFVGYCIYFDQKRRSDPSFRKKLREKRRRGGKKGSSSSSSAASVKWPDLSDQEAIQKFFLSSIQAGEELLSAGDMEGGVVYLSRAVAVCGQPQNLLQVLQQTLPPQVFQMLLQELPVAGKSVMEAAGVNSGEGKKITEEDLE